jgi:hypothetical protein
VFIAFGIQQAMRVRHIIICGLSGCTVFIHIISQTARYSKEKKKSMNIKDGSVQLLFFQKLFLRRNERDMIMNVFWSSCKVPDVLVKF